ncbi:DNRLRE domain-containing protein [uncultured Desulfobulbus sp.]|uniref:DNRLRE domain-containing protein n=1 Tax=uncultured Desulfobulbus sp. TaxID=239745 RepID=UPI0029C7DE35|nr:DNRLRE domain-containing protein [uncultured Desulfobulbus sp.]
MNKYQEIYPNINWFQLSEMYAPNVMKFEWNASVKSLSGQDYDIVCQLNRVGGGYSSGDINSSQATYQQGAYHFTAVDSNGFTSNTPYQYQVKVIAGGAPPPHNDEYCGIQNCDATSHESIMHYWWAETTATIDVTPIKIYPNHNQSVDSRYDLRRADNHFLDFQFGSRIYKGGLFVGYAADGSRVGRSFIKHQMPISLPSNEHLWAGSFNIWYTGCATSNTTTVACIPVSDVWTQQTIVWSTAPSVNPSQATNGVSIPSNTQPGWIRWPMDHEITNALRSVVPNKFAVALASTNENSPGWAYFAKWEYSEPKRAVLLYATKEPLMVTDLTITPGSVVGGNGNTATGTVTINWPATGTGFIVELKLQACSSYPAPLSFPSSVTIPTGSTSATFTINTTYPNTFSVTATIRAGENARSSTMPMYFKDKDMYIRQM